MSIDKKTLRALKALASDKRLKVLDWLKEPEKNFPHQKFGDLVKDGVCSLLIARKLKVSQPTATEHMKILKSAGLVTGKRMKQWTFYQRNEAAIRAAKKLINTSL